MNQQQAVMPAASRPTRAVTEKRETSLRIWLWPMLALLVVAGWAVRTGDYY